MWDHLALPQMANPLQADPSSKFCTLPNIPRKLPGNVPAQVGQRVRRCQADQWGTMLPCVSGAVGWKQLWNRAYFDHQLRRWRDQSWHDKGWGSPCHVVYVYIYIIYIYIIYIIYIYIMQWFHSPAQMTVTGRSPGWIRSACLYFLKDRELWRIMLAAS